MRSVDPPGLNTAGSLLVQKVLTAPAAAAVPPNTHGPQRRSGVSRPARRCPVFITLPKLLTVTRKQGEAKCLRRRAEEAARGLETGGTLLCGTMWAKVRGRVLARACEGY